MSAGGGFAEGYYIHYWLYEWLFFCEAARRCGGNGHFAMGYYDASQLPFTYWLADTFA